MPVVVKCPACGTEVRWSNESRFRPFCSQRCRTIDLGAWASEHYSISGATGDDAEAKPDDPKRSNA
jgi:uncharacterized protein